MKRMRLTLLLWRLTPLRCEVDPTSKHRLWPALALSNLCGASNLSGCQSKCYTVTPSISVFPGGSPKTWDFRAAKVFFRRRFCCSLRPFFSGDKALVECHSGRPLRDVFVEQCTPVGCEPSRPKTHPTLSSGRNRCNRECPSGIRQGLLKLGLVFHCARFHSNVFRSACCGVFWKLMALNA